MADGDLFQADFGDWFDFTRPTQKTYLDADGVEQLADVDEVRFDHDVAGTPRGLFVERGAALGQSDMALLQAGVLAADVDTACTVLHARILDVGSTGSEEHTSELLSLMRISDDL